MSHHLEILRFLEEPVVEAFMQVLCHIYACPFRRINLVTPLSETDESETNALMWSGGGNSHCNEQAKGRTVVEHYRMFSHG